MVPAGALAEPGSRSMPIDYSIDHERRLVHARAHGVFTHEDVFGYQRDAWSSKDVAGYDEIVDMSDVESIVQPPVENVRDLASLAAEMDLGTAPSRLAIVAPTDIAYGLGRMYQAYRETDERSHKEVAVFRKRDDAFAFIRREKRPA
jgi:hypothetical protein